MFGSLARGEDQGGHGMIVLTAALVPNQSAELGQRLFSQDIVPMVTDTRSTTVHRLPIVAAAPSPIPKKIFASASSGHRSA